MLVPHTLLRAAPFWAPYERGEAAAARCLLKGATQSLTSPPLTTSPGHLYDGALARLDQWHQGKQKLLVYMMPLIQSGEGEK